MKNQNIGPTLLASMAAHGDTDRFIADCWEKADRVVEFGRDETTDAQIFYFPDGSRIEFDRHDSHIRAFSPCHIFA